MTHTAADALDIRDARLDDAPALVAIYNHFVDHTIVTFEEAPVPAADFARRMQAITDATLPYLVAERRGQVVGYASATRWKERSGYRFAVEATVYLAPDEAGRGLGSALYAALFERLEAWGAHTVMGGIALPNDTSVALHEKFGMRKVAHFEAVGFKFGRWIDVGYWQRVLQQ